MAQVKRAAAFDREMLGTASEVGFRTIELSR